MKDLLAAARRRAAERDFPAAVQILGGLLQAHPGNREVLLELSRLSGRMGNGQDALTLLQLARQAHPDDCELALEQAGALERLGRIGEARAILDGLATDRPDDPTPLLRLSYFLRRRNEHGDAERICRRLVADHPRFAMGWVSHGISDHIAGRVEAAEGCFRQALSLDTNDPVAHVARATNLLAMGRWEQGFAEFGWRRRLPDAPPAPGGLPAWQGTEPAGTPVILWNDQGFGDAMQFLRYLPQVAARGCRPILVLAKELVRLARTLPGVGPVVPAGSPLPAADRQLPLCDLPHVLHRTEPADSWAGPYLSPDRPPAFENTGRRRVGVAWAGSPLHENDANRSASLADLAPLLDLPRIDWISLQIGPRAADIGGTPWAGRLADMSPDITDFADTAAIISGLDLVITVDSAVAHLAGAMGKPTWIMLPRRADWRWLRDGTTTAWYPSARLFRQRGEAGWPPVAADLAKALEEFYA